MPKALENKLSMLIHEIKEIKKEIIFKEITTAHASKNKLNKWKVLGNKVSSLWDKVSAVEEILQQREKSW